MHSYSLPKGFKCGRKRQVLSEAEQFNTDKYSKKAVELLMIDKYGQKFNLGGSNYGLKGSKVKPVYFPFNPATSNSSIIPFGASGSTILPDE